MIARGSSVDAFEWTAARRPASPADRCETGELPSEARWRATRELGTCRPSLDVRARRPRSTDVAATTRQPVDRGPLARHGSDASRIGGPQASGAPWLRCLANRWSAGLWPAMAPMPRESVVRGPLTRHGFDASRIGGPQASGAPWLRCLANRWTAGPPWLRCLANRWTAGLWPAMASMPRESVVRGPLARHGFDASRIGGPRASGPPLVGTIADATT